MAVRPTQRDYLDALLTLFGGELETAFRGAISDVVDNAIIGRMITSIETGDVAGAFQALGFTPAAMRPLTATIERAFEQGGIMTGKTFPKHLETASGRAVFRFDVRNSRAEGWLRDHSAELVTRLTDEARVNVQSAMTAGMIDGRNPRNVALDIVGRIDPQSGSRTGGLIGLTNTQEGWVRSARAKLLSLDNAYFDMKLRDKRFDKTVAKAIDTNKPLPPEIVQKLVDRYKDNALKLRGETVARTEALASLNRSEWEATKQAVDTGAITNEQVRRFWDNAGDKRVRDSHIAMEGQERGLDEPFIAPSGARLMHPGDMSLGAGGEEIILCRCKVRTKIDWLANIS